MMVLVPFISIINAFYYINTIPIEYGKNFVDIVQGFEKGGGDEI